MRKEIAVSITVDNIDVLESLEIGIAQINADEMLSNTLLVVYAIAVLWCRMFLLTVFEDVIIENHVSRVFTRNELLIDTAVQRGGDDFVTNVIIFQKERFVITIIISLYVLDKFVPFGERTIILFV